jgi:hypothetical protein
VGRGTRVVDRQPHGAVTGSGLRVGGRLVPRHRRPDGERVGGAGLRRRPCGDHDNHDHTDDTTHDTTDHATDDTTDHDTNDTTDHAAHDTTDDTAAGVDHHDDATARDNHDHATAGNDDDDCTIGARPQCPTIHLPPHRA